MGRVYSVWRLAQFSTYVYISILFLFLLLYENYYLLKKPKFKTLIAAFSFLCVNILMYEIYRTKVYIRIILTSRLSLADVGVFRSLFYFGE